jgi:NADPH:quinone reductase-like Zn-dependent oxidoreductase
LNYSCGVRIRHAHRIDSKLSDIELASFPCSYSTAENLLTRTRVVSGDIVLITGVSGGVGSAALQLAKTRGAHVVAVTGADKSEELIKLGADRVLIRGSSLDEALGRNSVDVVIDLVAGQQWPELLDIFRPGGRYGVAGRLVAPWSSWTYGRFI